MLVDPKAYRTAALRCSEHARAAPTTDVQEFFLELAQSWNRLAAELEATEDFISMAQGLKPNSSTKGALLRDRHTNP
jgi:hypothetical protein